MAGIGIILNPHSRSNLKNPERAKRLGFIVGDKGSCHETRDLVDVEILARQFMERDIEILGISGGDGTNHVTLTTFLKVYGEKPLPHIAVLRGGTMNNLATAIGVKGSPEKILSNLILKYHEGEPFHTAEVDLMKINDKYGFIFGMGMVSNFIDEYNKTDKKPSPLRALSLLTRVCLSSIFHTKLATRMNERFDAEVTIDGKVMPFKNYTTVLAGTVETLGLNFRVLYRARKQPGHFHFRGISATPRHTFLTVPLSLMARPQCSENHIDEVGTRLIITCDRPMPFQIDGDPQMPAKDFEITVGPRLTCIVS